MNERQLAEKLWEVIHGLARIRVFLSATDHLSDRELYTTLWRDVLREEKPLLPDDRDSAWHVDLIGSGGDADTDLYLKYYADESARQQWLADFPDYVMHEDAPFRRDGLLPQEDDDR